MNVKSPVQLVNCGLMYLPLPTRQHLMRLEGEHPKDRQADEITAGRIGTKANHNGNPALRNRVVLFMALNLERRRPIT